VQLDGTPDDVAAAHNGYDIEQSLADSPTSATATLTFADIVASSSVRTWTEHHGGGRCEQEDSSSSSDCSTVTATTVRTVITRPTTTVPDERTSTTMTPVSSTPRSKSRPATARVHQRQLTTTTVSRARSVSQSRQLSSDHHRVTSSKCQPVQTVVQRHLRDKRTEKRQVSIDHRVQIDDSGNDVDTCRRSKKRSKSVTNQ